MAQKVWMVYYDGEVEIFRHRAAAMNYLGIAYEETASYYLDRVRSPKAKDLLNRILKSRSSGDNLVNEYCNLFREGHDMIPEFMQSWHEHMEINEDPE